MTPEFLCSTTGRRGAKRRREPETSHHTGYPGQHGGWANTVSGVRERNGSRGLSSCLGTCFNSRKLSEGETVNTLLFLDAQSQTEVEQKWKHSKSTMSHRRIFFNHSEASLGFSITAANYFQLFEQLIGKGAVLLLTYC